MASLAQAQEREGIIVSNYHPTSSVHFNPSTSVDSRPYMQFNIVGVDAGVFTNLLFLPNFYLPKFILSPGVPAYEPITKQSKKYLYAAAVVDGPAFYISKKNFGAGLFVRARSVADVRRMPYQITELLLGSGTSNLSEVGNVDIKNAKFSNMTWLEYGINGGYVIKKRAYEHISIGANLKYLTGINLQYVNLKRITGDYNSSLITVSALEGQYKSAALAYGAGKGFSTDLGITYKKMLKQVDSYESHSKNSSSHCKIVDYEYKVGVSLRDLGYINFKKGTNVVDLQGAGIIDLNSKQDPQDQFTNNFSTSETPGKKITAFLPAAITISGDYNFGNSFYLAAIVQKGILPNAMTGVQAADYLAVVPRFEKKNIEVSIPLSVQKFIQPELGLAIRFRSFVIGVDNILPAIKPQNTKSVGVYFNLGWTLFRNKKCGAGAGKIDDCSHYKKGSGKIKRKNELISYKPLREQKHKKPKGKKKKLFRRH